MPRTQPTDNTEDIQRTYHGKKAAITVAAAATAAAAAATTSSRAGHIILLGHVTAALAINQLNVSDMAEPVSTCLTRSHAGDDR